MRRTLVAMAILALPMAACGGGTPKPGPTTPPATSSRPSSTAKLGVLSPQPGSTITGTKTLVKISLTGAHISKVVSTNLKPDEGHIHVKLDGITKTLLASLEYELTGLTPGPHLLEVEFAANDHGQFFPRVLVNVPFTVQ